MNSVHLPATRDAWSTQDFETVAKREIAALNTDALPLQQALSVSSHVAASPIQAMILARGQENGRYWVKAGIFYTGIIAGCNCADDPTPANEQAEYCVLRFDIDPATAKATISYLAD